MKEPVCKNCGRCCHIRDGDSYKDCPFLYRRKDGETRCKVYETRLGRRIGPHNKCTLRILSPYDYPECPYNTGKPIHPLYDP